MASIIRRGGSHILSLIESGADPAAVANAIELYAKDSAGITQLFARSSDGTVHQLTPPSGGATTYTTRNSDSFNRADAPANLGSTDGANSNDPAVWTQNRGTWGIISNTAYVSAVGSGTQFNSASINLGAVGSSQWTQITVTTLPTANGTGIGVVLGLVNADNFYYAQCNRSSGGAFSYIIGKLIAGVGASLVTASGQVPVAGDVIKLEREYDGLLRLSVNGSVIAAAFDGQYPVGTRVGMFEITSGGVVSGGRLDAFSAGTVS